MKKVIFLFAIIFSMSAYAEGLINYTPPQMDAVQNTRVGGGTRSLDDIQSEQPKKSKHAKKHKKKHKHNSKAQSESNQNVSPQ